DMAGGSFQWRCRGLRKGRAEKSRAPVEVTQKARAGTPCCLRESHVVARVTLVTLMAFVTSGSS
ncbi:MAG: hypothetical protein ACJ8HC_07415, partial [Paraburkholderia graminis]|uniref:hypothetical protein n=1 Tax=Paraburkholderia graminis TaxID=60548 RepID=UPI003899A0D8